MKTPIGIIRRLRGPSAVISIRGDLPALERKRSARPALENLRAAYEIYECPLAEADANLFPRRDRVLRAWRYLANRRKLDEYVAREINLVLRETAPAPDEKAPTPSAREHALRSGILARDAWTHLFHVRGLDLVHGDEQPRVPDPVRISRALPRAFALRILPCLIHRRGGTEYTGALLARYWRLELDKDQALLAAAARLLALSPPESALSWLDVLTHQPPQRRAIFLTLLLETEAYSQEPPAWLIPYANEMNGLIKDELYAYRMLVVLSPDGRACRPDYLMAGFRLSNRFAEHFPFAHVHELGESRPASEKALLKLCEYIADADGFYDEFPLRLWEKCARRPELPGLISELNWFVFAPATALALLRLFMDCPSRSWERVRAWAGPAERELSALAPEYRLKAIAFLSRAAEFHAKDSPEMDFTFARDIIRRICAKPFAILPADLKPLTTLTALLREHARDLAVRASVNSLRALEKICSSDNRAPLASLGLGALAAGMPEFTLAAFHDFPARLMKSAELLGTFSDDIARQMTDEFSRSPIMLNFENEGCLDLDRLRRWAYPRLFNPVPARLLAHFRGERQLNERALRADLRRAHVDITLLRLEVLDEMVRRRLAMGIARDAPSPDEEPEHSLRMLRIIDANIRALKRFLRARAQGRDDFLRNHPANLGWLRSHAGVPADLWRSGFQMRAQLRSGELVYLAVEQDPDEILMMGTYFDTCLGLGGVNAFSAAAILLDVNKQVVYARDAKGRPLGRQLLAVSEQGRLVCFQVYASDRYNQELREIFQHYDQNFARMLGLPLHDDESAGYEIRLLVAEEWYDDGVWVPE